MTSLFPSRHAVDLTGANPDNAVVGEPHTLARRKVRVIAPMHAPYFKKNLVITDTVSNKVLTAAQYRCLNLVALPSAMAGIGNEVYAIIAITDRAVSDSVVITYQTVGGHYTRSYATTQSLIETLSNDTRPASWENILEANDAFEPSLHLHAVGDAIGWEYVAVALEGLRSTLLLGDAVGHDEILSYIDTQLAPIKALLDELEGANAFTAHTTNYANPHKVSKVQVGLGNVQNYPLASDAEALAGTATNRYMTTALVSKLISGLGGADLSAHAADKANPHQVTKLQVGLGNVQNYPMASDAEALAGSAPNRYLSPTSLKAALVPFEISTLRVVVNEASVLAAGGFKEYDLQTLLGSDYGQYNLSSPSVIFRIKDTAAGVTNGMYINAWPVAVAAVYSNRYVRLHSKHASALDCRVLIGVGKGAGFLTPLVPSYTLTSSTASVNEGSSVTFSLQTTNVPNDTVLYWTTGGTNVSSSDFRDGQMSGSVTVLNNAASLVRTLRADATTEGTEAFVISLRSDSITGTVVVGASSVSIGDSSLYIANGTLLSQACSGTSMVGTYANGSGGTYTAVITTNSTSCGYVAPPSDTTTHPAYGTLLSQACSGTSMVGTYANGSGGTYTAVITTNSTSCGYVAPTTHPAYGTILNTYCSGVDKMANYADGSGGSYSGIYASNSPDCGYVAYPARGTYLRYYCGSGNTTKMGVYADGSGGEYGQLIQENSPDCGYVAPSYPARGTYLRYYCGTGNNTKMGVYADGSGGEYGQLIQENSPDCGYVAPSYPARGTVLSISCVNDVPPGGGGSAGWVSYLQTDYADGTGGTYSGYDGYNMPNCQNDTGGNG